MTDFLLPAFEAVLQMSLGATFLILGLLGACQCLRRWLPISALYILCFIVIVRLTVPYFPQSDYSLASLLPYLKGSIEMGQVSEGELAPMPLVSLSEAASTGVHASSDRVSSLSVLAIVWLGGFCVLLSWQLMAYARFRHWILLQPEVSDVRVKALFKQCRQQVGLRRRVDLISVDRMRLPAVFGVVRPKVLLPEHLANQMDECELKHILLHELCHVKRQDALIGMVSYLVAMVHWFNPVIWLASRRFSLLRELLCDRAVIQALKSTPSTEASYGETLIRAATLFQGRTTDAPGLVPFLSHKDEIKQRLTMIVKPTSKHWLRTVAGWITGVGLVAASMTLVAMPTPIPSDGEVEQRERREQVETERREKALLRERLERFEHERKDLDAFAKEQDHRLRDIDRAKAAYEERIKEYRKRVEMERIEDPYADQGQGGVREKRFVESFPSEKVKAQIQDLVAAGKLDQARKLEAKLRLELERREEMRAKLREADVRAEENLKLRGHISRLTASLDEMQEKMEHLQRKVEELSKRK